MHDHGRAPFDDYCNIVGPRALVARRDSFSLSILLVRLSRCSSHFTHSNLSHVGTSVEVRHIAIDLIGPWTTSTNVNYSIDGSQLGVKQRKSTNQTDYLYDQFLFRIDGLSDVEHTLRVDVHRPGVLLVGLVGNRVGGAKVPF